LTNSLAGQNVDAEPALVEVLDIDGATSESSDELDIALVKEVVFFSGETGVGLLLDLEDDVASLDARCLITVAAELDLGASANTTVDMNVEHLTVHNGLLSVALLAAILVLDDLTLAVAVGADGLESLDHGTHLAHHCLHTLTVTSSTPAHSALLASVTLALGADDGPLQGELGNLSAVYVLERDLVRVVDCSCLGGTALATAAKHTAHAAEAAAASSEELSEQILGGHATAAGTALETSLTILVVESALLGVGKNLVGVRNLLELLLGIGVVGVLVWCEGLV
jgi:hypothetical protein